jgi:methylenetetrahydrofolate--tRNA-(uracil-5-)-methyltransferase
VIGGGLAGCEAAWQAARFGTAVDLYEMRPQRSGPAHKTAGLAELVCSNSLRGASLENAVGLLKEELSRLDSVIMSGARAAAVPAGNALAVDRERFSQAVEEHLAGNSAITIHRREVRTIPRDGPVIVACGPLPSEDLLSDIDALLTEASAQRSARTRLHYYDAASPIVAADSIDISRRISRTAKPPRRTSKVVFRLKRWPIGETTRCALAHSNPSVCATRVLGKCLLPSCSCAKRTSRVRHST